MIVGLTISQVDKINNLHKADFAKLKFIIKNGGSVNYTNDLESLKNCGIIKKIGGACFANFYINGHKPIECSGSKRKSAGSEIFAYRRMWEKITRTEATPLVMGLIKKFMSNYSLIEFKRILSAAKSWGVIENSESIKRVWVMRDKFKQEDDSEENRFDSI